MAAMEVAESMRGEWRIVSVKGRIDSDTAPKLTSALLAAIASHPQVAVDCSNVDYISSAGISTLVNGARAARTAQHELVVCAPNARVKQVFEISRLRDLLNLRETLPGEL